MRASYVFHFGSFFLISNMPIVQGSAQVGVRTTYIQVAAAAVIVGVAFFPLLSLSSIYFSHVFLSALFLSIHQIFVFGLLNEWIKTRYDGRFSNIEMRARDEAFMSHYLQHCASKKQKILFFYYYFSLIYKDMNLCEKSIINLNFRISTKCVCLCVRRKKVYNKFYKILLKIDLK